jgi:hypothetical protein
LEREARRLKWAQEAAERKKVDEWYEGFHKRALDRELREIEERRLHANAEIITDAFENAEAFKNELTAERAKLQPNPIMAELYRGDIARAQNWCDHTEIPFPMTGVTVADFLYEMAGGTRESIEPETFDRVKRMSKALEWGHATNGCYLEKAPIVVVMNFLEEKVERKEKPDAK